MRHKGGLRGVLTPSKLAATVNVSNNHINNDRQTKKGKKKT